MRPTIIVEAISNYFLSFILAVFVLLNNNVQSLTFVYFIVSDKQTKADEHGRHAEK